MKAMTRLQLAQVTLCAVDTRTPALAAQSLQRSMANVDFARVLLFTSGWSPPAALASIDMVEIPRINSGVDYSHFVMRELPAHITTSHVLVTQWDGFVTDVRAWDADFLACDYIGAVWPDQPASTCVGNGGFSLRSRRFLNAGLDPRITQPHPEDLVLCRDHRSLLEREHGVRFASPALARRFAYENEVPAAPTFGFHGPYNLPRWLDEPALLAGLQAMPNDFFRSRDARRLARALLARRMTTAAQHLLRRRQAAGRTDPNTRLLGAAASLLAYFSRRGSTSP